MLASQLLLNVKNRQANWKNWNIMDRFGCFWSNYTRTSSRTNLAAQTTLGPIYIFVLPGDRRQPDHEQAFHIFKTRRLIPMTKLVVQRIKEARQRNQGKEPSVLEPRFNSLAEAARRFRDSRRRDSTSTTRTVPRSTDHQLFRRWLVSTWRSARQ